VDPSSANGRVSGTALSAERAEVSLGGGRVPGFGRIDLVEYVRMAKAEIMVVPMIEDEQGVDNLPAILADGGVDLIFEGAADLSQSYGVHWRT
jgi:staphyloferrin B biosynthesis citrate synthase